MSSLPLVSHVSPECIIAWRADGAVTLRQFLAEVSQLVALFPAGSHLSNICSDRYRFSVGLAAALRGLPRVWWLRVWMRHICWRRYVNILTRFSCRAPCCLSMHCHATAQENCRAQRCKPCFKHAAHANPHE